MNTINSNQQGFDTNVFRMSESVSAADATAKTQTELGQEDFLTLMLQQIKNQDPFKPMENGDFLAQMAQFSTVSGIGEMQDSIENMATSFQSNQVLQASNLVGKKVLVPSETLSLQSGDSLSGELYLPTAASSVKMDIYDSNDVLLQSVELGSHSQGVAAFSFAPVRADGSPISGNDIQVKASFSNGESYESITPFVENTVDSITIGSQGEPLVDLNLSGYKSLYQVSAIKN